MTRIEDDGALSILLPDIVNNNNNIFNVELEYTIEYSDSANGNNKIIKTIENQKLKKSLSLAPQSANKLYIPNECKFSNLNIASIYMSRIVYRNVIVTAQHAGDVVFSAVSDKLLERNFEFKDRLKIYSAGIDSKKFSISNSKSLIDELKNNNYKSRFPKLLAGAGTGTNTNIITKSNVIERKIPKGTRKIVINLK